MSTRDGSASVEFLARVGREVRRRRRAAELTAQALADRSGVSRRMITQIEQGDANPSLVTIDKLAHALGTDFAALTAPTSPQAVQVSERPTEVWRSPAGSHALLHIASAHRGGPELWEWTLRANESYAAQPDPPGSEELILVQSGELTIHTDGQAVPVRVGHSARLASDRHYTYTAGEDGATFVRVVEIAIQ